MASREPHQARPARSSRPPSISTCLRRRKQVLMLGGLLLLAGLAWWGSRLAMSARAQFGTKDWVNQLLGEFSLLQGVLVPSHWMSLGIRAAGQGELGPMVYYLALVWSNGLFLYVITAWTARRLYRPGYNRVATGGSLRRRYG